MKTSNILTIVLMSLIRAQDPFYNDEKISAEVSPRAQNLANKPKWENPIYLDAMKNGLLPNKILTTFKSPKFIGSPPPGITTFMASQVFLSGEKKDGFVYPLFLKQAIEDFDGKQSKFVVEDVCSKKENGEGKCPIGYKKITVSKSATDSSSEKCAQPSGEKKTEEPKSNSS